MPRVKTYSEEDLLEKATTLFWENGYTATGIQELTDYLQVNRTTIYRAFGDKKGLFLEALKRYRNSALKSMQAQLQKNQPVKTLFRTVLQNSVRCPNCAKGCFITNTTAELIPQDKDILEFLKENQQKMISVFVEPLKRAQETGELSADKDINTIATLIFTLHNGLKVVGKTGTGIPDQDAVIESALRVLD